MWMLGTWAGRRRDSQVASPATVESLSELSVGEFGDDVEVAKVARILLNQVEQDAFERRGFGPIPARTRFAHLRKVMILNDGSTAHGLRPQRACQRVECLLGTDEPTVTTIVAPRDP